MAASLIPQVNAQGEYVIFPETASVSSSDLVPHNFMLKAISKQNSEVEKVSGFKIDPVNVLSISEGGVISATSTDQSIVFEQAKAKSSTDSLFELQKAIMQGQPQQPNNGFSIAGLAPGVYTLDIIAAKSNAKAAYEGILVIGQNAESQEVKQVIEREITEVEQDTDIGDTITIFQLPPNPQPAPGPLIVQQQQQQPAVIPPGGQAPVNQPPPQSLAASQQQQQQQQQQPPPTPAAPPGTIPSAPPQALAAQQPPKQQQQPAAITPGGQAPVNQPPSLPPSQVQQALTGQQQQPLSPSSSNNEPDNGNEPDPCLLNPNSPECQVVDTFETPSGTESCPEGTEGTPPDCSPPVEPESEPVDLASTDLNDPLFGDEETGESGEGEEGAEDTDESEDTGADGLESGSESGGDGGDSGGGEEGGDGEGGNGEGGNGDQGGGDGGE